MGLYYESPFHADKKMLKLFKTSSCNFSRRSFNHMYMYIVDAQDAGASPPGSAPHLQWGQVGDQNLGMLTKTIYWIRCWFYGHF